MCSFRLFGYDENIGDTDGTELHSPYPLDLYTNAFGTRNHLWLSNSRVILCISQDLRLLQPSTCSLDQKVYLACQIPNYDRERPAIRRADTHIMFHAHIINLFDCQRIVYLGPESETLVAHTLPLVTYLHLTIAGPISFKFFERLHSIEYIFVEFDAAEVEMELDPEGYLINMKQLKCLELDFNQYNGSFPYKIDALGFFKVLSPDYRSRFFMGIGYGTMYPCDDSE